MNNPTSQIKNKLTMVCLTYNRQSFAKRQLLYFADKPVNYPKKTLNKGQ